MPYNTAYDIHRSRIMLEKINRESLFKQNMPSSSMLKGIESKLSNSDLSLNNIGYTLQDIRFSTEEGDRLNAKALGDIAKATEYLGDQFHYSIKDVSSQINSLQETIEDGFYQLSAIFSYEMSEVVWHLEQSNKLLTDILATLKAPRKTQADELRLRGNELFLNGLNARFDEDRQNWMKLSLEAYKECIEKNPVDFSAFQSCGIIHFFELKDAEEAIKAFRSAATFAEPYSKYYAAFAWLHLGYVFRCSNDLQKAYDAASQALSLKPDWAEANFQCAIYSGLLGRIEEMKNKLEKSILLNRNYWFRATTEPDFILVMKHVSSTLTEIKNQLHKNLTKQLSDLNTKNVQLQGFFKEAVLLKPESFSSEDYLFEINELLKTITKSVNSNSSYFELCNTPPKITQGFEIISEKIRLLKKNLEDVILSTQNQIKVIHN